MAFVECDVIRLAEIVVSSTPERDPVQFSKQWPELLTYQMVKQPKCLNKEMAKVSYIMRSLLNLFFLKAVFPFILSMYYLCTSVLLI